MLFVSAANDNRWSSELGRAENRIKLSDCITEGMIGLLSSCFLQLSIG